MNQARVTLDKIIDGTARDTELEAFVFFGGCPIDLLSGFADESSLGDIDISVPGIGTEQMDRYESTVQRNGYTITTARRLYVISRNIPVFTTFARNENTVIDANFMEDPTRVGLFNIDSMYVVFPERKIVDLYGSLEGLKSKTIVPIHDLSSESPYFLGSRFIYISSKYDISMVDRNNIGVAEAVVRHMINEPRDQRGEFNSFLPSVFKSILRTRDRVSYLREMIEIGILNPRLSELETAIKQVMAGQHSHEMEKIEKVDDLIVFFAGYIPQPLKGNFYEKIKPLSDRIWENDNRRVSEIPHK